MKYAIIDSAYKSRAFAGMAASWLKWEAARHKVTLTDPQHCDVALITCCSAQVREDVFRALKRHRVPKSARIIIGGGCGMSPASFADLDYVCCGEGARAVRTLFTQGLDAFAALPNIWSAKHKPGHVAIPDYEFPWDTPPLKNTDGQTRIFISRGCKRKCLFCQTGWEQPYRSNPDKDRVKQQIAELQRLGRKFSCVTNDGAEEAALVRNNVAVSVTMSALKRIMPISRDFAHSVRIGIEGVSERIREAVKKPVANDDILRVCHDLLANKVGVTLFFILGLPGETAADYAELKDLILAMKRGIRHGCVLMSFHTYTPKPATPLVCFPLKDEYMEHWQNLMSWFFEGPGFTSKIQLLLSGSRYKGRLRQAMNDLACTEQALREGFFEQDVPQWKCIRYPASPDVLRRLARTYATKMEIPIDGEQKNAKVLSGDAR